MSVDSSIDQSINQSIDWSIDTVNNPSLNQSIKRPNSAVIDRDVENKVMVADNERQTTKYRISL